VPSSFRLVSGQRNDEFVAGNGRGQQTRQAGLGGTALKIRLQLASQRLADLLRFRDDRIE